MGRRSGTKEELIKCEYCGEMYAASYKHCPFCNEDGTGRWDDPDAADDDLYDDELPVRGGRRLAHGSRPSRGGGNGPSVGRIISWVLSLALIIAAAGIVISLVKPLLGKGKEPQSTVSTPPTEVSAEPSVAPTQPVAPPSIEPTVDPEPQPTAPGIQTPSVPLVTPTDFKLSRDDISFFAVGETYQFKVTLTPADAHSADIVWKSSDPNVASVSWNGLVTAVSKGTVKVTASIEGVGERSCVVRCNFSGSAPTATTAPSETTTSEPSGSTSKSNLSLNREDFTLSYAGDSWRLVVKGTSSAVTWASTKPEVATVGADGTVTAVSKGTCRVTATVDGVTLKCIVRCSF